MALKQIESVDHNLLALIVRVYTERGPILRDRLSVLARGRGIEVARSLLHLKAAGLVEEAERRPKFFLRILRAKPEFYVHPTDSGLALVCADGQQAALRDESLTVASLPTDEVILPQLPQATTEGESDTTVTSAAALPKFLRTSVRRTTLSSASQEQGASRLEPMQSPRVTARYAHRPALSDFTEVLGGTPIAYNPRGVTQGVPKDVMDGLREWLDVVGLQLTGAGEDLIEDRMAKGASQGEALLQVVLFAFAHGVYLDAVTDGNVQALGLQEYAIEVMREVEKLRDAGEIRDDRFESDMRCLWALVTVSADQFQQAKGLLADPVGGAAPIAILPEELREIELEGTDAASGHDWWPSGDQIPAIGIEDGDHDL